MGWDSEIQTGRRHLRAPRRATLAQRRWLAEAWTGHFIHHWPGSLLERSSAVELDGAGWHTGPQTGWPRGDWPLTHQSPPTPSIRRWGDYEGPPCRHSGAGPWRRMDPHSPVAEPSGRQARPKPPAVGVHPALFQPRALGDSASPPPQARHHHAGRVDDVGQTLAPSGRMGLEAAPLQAPFKGCPLTW